MGQKKKTGVSPKTIKWIWYAAFAPFALVALMLVLTVFGVFGRMPSFEELENPRSNLATEIYSEDGKVIGTFFVQNRSYVQYADLYPSDSTLHIRLAGHEVPPIVAALIATEDVRFRTHSGIDIPSLARVAVKTLLLQNTSQGGGSTITQQLAKNLFPRDTVRNRGAVVRKAKLVTSKFKEWITALKLEYNYTKEEIAAMYLNTVEFGSNAFGIKSAAHTFFNKEPDELNVQEAAVLVGVVNAPTRYSPILNPKNALVRRNLVLSRMEEAGALTRRPIATEISSCTASRATATHEAVVTALFSSAISLFSGIPTNHMPAMVPSAALTGQYADLYATPRMLFCAKTSSPRCKTASTISGDCSLVPTALLPSFMMVVMARVSPLKMVTSMPLSFLSQSRYGGVTREVPIDSVPTSLPS